MTKFDYVNAAQEMVDRDSGRDKLFAAQEDMFHSQWAMPKELAALDWIRQVTSTDPHDAVQAGVRMFSTNEPKISYVPMLDNPDTKKRGATIEKFLKFWLKGASDRRRSTIVADLVRSALLYDMVAVQVINVKYQEKLYRDMSLGGKNRRKGIKENGPYIVRVHNPKHVHATFSDYGLEAVYMSQRHTRASAMAFWGKKAADIALWDDKGVYCYEHDYSDHERRIVWITADSEVGAGVEVLNEVRKTPLTDMWSVRVGGTTLEENAEFQYKPLLESIYRAGQWDTQNVVETLWISDVIARAAQPRGIKEGPNPDKIEKDYGEPGGDILVPPGHKYTQNPQEPLDANLMTVGDRIQAAVSKSTVPKVVMGGDLPANTQFATVNLVVQTAVGSLMPYKRLAELAIKDICGMMIRWLVNVGETETMYGSTKGRDGDFGKLYQLEPDTFDLEDPLFINVELTADVPTDRIQRINAANLAKQTLGYSQVSALEDIGVTDPDKELRQSSYEQLYNAKLQAQLKLELAKADLEIQKAQAEIQLQMSQAQMQMQAQLQMQMQQVQQQQAMAQQQALAQQKAQESAASEQQNAQQLINENPDSGVGGQGFNPAAGGQPPAMANPEATYEGQTGQSRAGAEFSMEGA